MLIFNYNTHHINNSIFSKISSANSIYLFHAIFGMISVVVYIFLILLIHHTFPIISKIINYFISFFGIYVSFAVVVDFITSLINLFNSAVKPTTHIQL